MIHYLVILSLLFATERGPWVLIGRVPDRNPYTCTETASGTYVGPAASITDSGCAVWTLGAGVSPDIAILRNGSQAASAFGVKLEYYNHVVYLLSDDTVNWYSWTGSVFNLFGPNDPSGGTPTPSGYFVSTTGNDSNSCMTATNVASPKRTVNSGISCLTVAGSTLWVRGGTYDESINNPFPTPGNDLSTGKIRVINYPGETVWLAPTAVTPYVINLSQTTQRFIEFDGINLDGTVVTAGAAKIEGGPNGPSGNANAHHIRMQNAEFKSNINLGSQGVVMDSQNDATIGNNELIHITVHRVGGDDFSHGVYIKSPNNLVDTCDIYDFPGGGIHIFAGVHPVNNNVIRNNTIHDGRSTAAGQRHWGVLLADGTTQELVYNNRIWNIPNEGGSSAAILALFSGSSNGIYNNTVTLNGGDGINIGNGDATPNGTIVRNNISWGNSGNAYIDSGTGTITSNNVCTSGCAINSNPLFVNSGALNFHIQSSSPAKNAALTLATIFTTDALGVPRPQGTAWDIGAFEDF